MRLLNILVFFMLIVSILLLAWAVYSTQLLPPPATLRPDHVTILGPHCPSDEITTDVELVINRPIVLVTDVSYIDTKTRRVISGLEYNQPDKVRPARESIFIPITFKIPNLPPGKYERVTAIQGKNQSAEPTFFIISFEIAKSCQ